MHPAPQAGGSWPVQHSEQHRTGIQLAVAHNGIARVDEV